MNDNVETNYMLGFLLLAFLIYLLFFASRRIYQGKLLAHPAVIVVTGIISMFGVKISYEEISSTIFVICALFSLFYFASFVRLLWTDPKVEKQWALSAAIFLAGTFGLTLHSQLLGGDTYHWIWAIFFMFWIILILIFRFRDPELYRT